jgi:hypothetical protein
MLRDMSRRRDIGWDYGYQVEGVKGIFCSFCDKNIKGGGVIRLKEHLAGIGNDVTPCQKVFPDVRVRIQDHLDEVGRQRIATGHAGRGRPRRRPEESRREQVTTGSSSQMTEALVEDDETRAQLDLEEALRRSTQDPEYLDQQNLELAL